MTTTAEPQHEAEPAARSPADATAATTVEEVALAPLERVPEPLGGDGVVGLGGVHAGGLEAVQAEWGRAGGTVVLAGRRPFVDATARAAFGPTAPWAVAWRPGPCSPCSGSLLGKSAGPSTGGRRPPTSRCRR